MVKKILPWIVFTLFFALLNILKPESQDLMKLYGIAAIPTQVLLNKEGKEFFRHTGYLSTSELTIKITNQ